MREWIFKTFKHEFYIFTETSSMIKFRRCQRFESSDFIWYVITDGIKIMRFLFYSINFLRFSRVFYAPYTHLSRFFMFRVIVIYGTFFCWLIFVCWLSVPSRLIKSSFDIPLVRIIDYVKNLNGKSFTFWTTYFYVSSKDSVNILWKYVM